MLKPGIPDTSITQRAVPSRIQRSFISEVETTVPTITLASVGQFHGNADDELLELDDRELEDDELDDLLELLLDEDELDLDELLELDEDDLELLELLELDDLELLELLLKLELLELLDLDEELLLELLDDELLKL